MLGNYLSKDLSCSSGLGQLHTDTPVLFKACTRDTPTYGIPVYNVVYLEGLLSSAFSKINSLQKMTAAHRRALEVTHLPPGGKNYVLLVNEVVLQQRVRIHLNLTDLR